MILLDEFRMARIYQDDDMTAPVPKDGHRVTVALRASLDDAIALQALLRTWEQGGRLVAIERVSAPAVDPAASGAVVSKLVAVATPRATPAPTVAPDSAVGVASAALAVSAAPVVEVVTLDGFTLDVWREADGVWKARRTGASWEVANTVKSLAQASAAKKARIELKAVSESVETPAPTPAPVAAPPVAQASTLRGLSVDVWEERGKWHVMVSRLPGVPASLAGASVSGGTRDAALDAMGLWIEAAMAIKDPAAPAVAVAPAAVAASAAPVAPVGLAALGGLDPATIPATLVGAPSMRKVLDYVLQSGLTLDPADEPAILARVQALQPHVPALSRIVDLTQRVARGLATLRLEGAVPVAQS